MLSRRSFLSLSSAGAASLLLPFGTAHASVFRAIGLEELVSASDTVLLATPLSSESRWEVVARRRRIVTYTRVRVDEALVADPKSTEELVRTLGGRVGDIGQVVHGEAVLGVAERSVLFLGRPTEQGARVVTAMAQGHYPLLADPKGALRLRPSPRLGELLERKGQSAVDLLSGRSLPEATRLIHRAVSR
ncbi:MAG TPA: hypothetical protein VKZ49_17825 [Polyangiaceae bacterium]|nr:hypothetical protein [Polyangiaceae bacterium]